MSDIQSLLWLVTSDTRKRFKIGVFCRFLVNSATWDPVQRKVRARVTRALLPAAEDGREEGRAWAQGRRGVRERDSSGWPWPWKPRRSSCATAPAQAGRHRESWSRTSG